MIPYREVLAAWRRKKEAFRIQGSFWKQEDEMVLKALEKFTPERPYSNRSDFRCPACKKRLMFKTKFERYHPMFCSRCGQKIDWTGYGKEKQ